MHLGFVVLFEGSFQGLDLVASVDGSSGAIVVSVLEEVGRVDAHLTNQQMNQKIIQTNKKLIKKKPLLSSFGPWNEHDQGHGGCL